MSETNVAYTTDEELHSHQEVAERLRRLALVSELHIGPSHPAHPDYADTYSLFGIPKDDPMAQTHGLGWIEGVTPADNHLGRVLLTTEQRAILEEQQ